MGEQLLIFKRACLSVCQSVSLGVLPLNLSPPFFVFFVSFSTFIFSILVILHVEIPLFIYPISPYPTLLDLIPVCYLFPYITFLSPSCRLLHTCLTNHFLALYTSPDARGFSLPLLPPLIFIFLFFFFLPVHFPVHLLHASFSFPPSFLSQSFSALLLR